MISKDINDSSNKMVENKMAIKCSREIKISFFISLMSIFIPTKNIANSNSIVFGYPIGYLKIYPSILSDLEIINKQGIGLFQCISINVLDFVFNTLIIYFFILIFKKMKNILRSNDFPKDNV